MTTTLLQQSLYNMKGRCYLLENHERYLNSTDAIKFGNEIYDQLKMKRRPECYPNFTSNRIAERLKPCDLRRYILKGHRRQRLRDRVIGDIDAFLYKEGLQNPEAINKPLKKGFK